MAGEPKPPLAESLTGDARTLYLEARDRFAAGDPATALLHFERAHRLAADPRLLWNMAACERKLGHNARVLELIDAYLASHELDENDRRQAEDAARAVGALVAELALETEPAGVDVHVDGRPVGRTPLSAPLRMDAGVRRLRLTAPGHREAVEVLRVEPGMRLALRIELEPSSPHAERAAPERVAPERSDAAPSPLGPILLGAAGLTLLVAAGALLGAAAAEHGALEEDCAPACPPERWHGARDMETAGYVVGAGGLATSAAAVVWALVGPSAPASAHGAACFFRF
jgi:hypothetical protein